MPPLAAADEPAPSESPEAPAPGAEPVPPGGLERPAKRRKTTGPPIALGSSVEHMKWIRDVEVEVPLSRLAWDEDGSQGQIRRLDDTTVASRLQGLRAQPIDSPVRVTLWPTDANGVFQILPVGRHHGV